MSKVKPISEIYSELASNSYVLKDVIPLGYGAGLPMLKKVQDKLCLQVLYWKCVVTGEKNKNLILPVRYALSFSLANLEMVEYVELMKEAQFKAVEFDKPIGVFPHKAIMGMNKRQYMAIKNDLFAALDKLVKNELEGNEDVADNKTFAILFTKLLEPSLKPIYQLINPDFMEKYYLA